MNDLERGYGDGQGFSPQGPEFFLKSKVSWKKKAYLAATSNGCNEPDAFIAEQAKILFGDVKHTKADMRVAAKQATTEYLRQNILYESMVDMAGKKDDKSLLISITTLPHFTKPGPTTEKKHVPLSYFDGLRTGFANDEAFSIIERISRIFDYKISDASKRTKVLKMLDTLEEQVEASSTIYELKENFFHALNPSKYERAEKSTSGGVSIAGNFFEDFGYAEHNPELMVLMDQIARRIIHTKVTSAHTPGAELSMEQIFDEIISIAIKVTNKKYPEKSMNDTPGEHKWQRLLRYGFDAMIKTKAISMKGTEIEKRKQAALEIVPRTLAFLDYMFEYEEYHMSDRWSEIHQKGLRE